MHTGAFYFIHLQKASVRLICEFDDSATGRSIPSANPARQNQSRSTALCAHRRLDLMEDLRGLREVCHLNNLHESVEVIDTHREILPSNPEKGQETCRKDG
jgi:hypothetical protein